MPALAIALKDIAQELRAKDIVVSALLFALLVIVVFNFALSPTPQTVALVAPGMLWVAFVFAGVLGVNRALGMEKESGGMQALMLAPVGREVIFFGKMLGNFVFMMLVEIVVFPVFAAMNNFSPLQPGVIPIALFATLGIAAVGTLFSAMAVNTRSREVMLPLLMFPALTPAIVAAVEATAAVTQGGEPGRWLPFLIVFDAVFLVACPLAFSAAAED